jgi:hypothetical protein
MAVQAEERDAFPRLYSDAAQRAGQSPHTVGKLRIAKPQVLTHHGSLAGKLLLGVTKKSDRG